MGVFASDPGDEGFELVFFGGCWAFEGSAGAAVGAAVAFGSGAGGAVAFGGVVAYQAFGVFGLTWFRLACGANLWGWLSCGGWVVGVLGTHFSAYNPLTTQGARHPPAGALLIPKTRSKTPMPSPKWP